MDEKFRDWKRKENVYCEWVKVWALDEVEPKVAVEVFWRSFCLLSLLCLFLSVSIPFHQVFIFALSYIYLSNLTSMTFSLDLKEIIVMRYTLAERRCVCSLCNAISHFSSAVNQIWHRNFILLCSLFKEYLICSKLPDLTILRSWRVLTMVYNTQNYWVLGLFHRPVY
jgi:hypothetical protein